MKICNNQEISLFTEFTTLSWTIILLIQIGVLCLYTWFYKMLTKSGMSKLNDVIQSSLNVCLRALINKGSKENFANSQAHKIFLFTISVMGLVLLSYYKAQMNAALNVEVDNMPIQSWQDLYQSVPNSDCSWNFSLFQV